MNCCLKPDSDSESRDALNKRIKELEQENSKLKNEKLCKNEENDWRENIDIFVEEWFEENKDDDDIGVVDFKLFKIDLLPDKVEKYIYKKVLKILYSFVTNILSPKNHSKHSKEN